MKRIQSCFSWIWSDGRNHISILLNYIRKERKEKCIIFPPLVDELPTDPKEIAAEKEYGAKGKGSIGSFHVKSPPKNENLNPFKLAHIWCKW